MGLQPTQEVTGHHKLYVFAINTKITLIGPSQLRDIGDGVIHCKSLHISIHRCNSFSIPLSNEQSPISMYDSNLQHNVTLHIKYICMPSKIMMV